MMVFDNAQPSTELGPSWLGKVEGAAEDALKAVYPRQDKHENDAWPRVSVAARDAHRRKQGPPLSGCQASSRFWVGAISAKRKRSGCGHVDATCGQDF